MKKIIVLLIIFLSSCSSEKEAAVDNTPKLLPTVKTITVGSIGVSSAEIYCEIVSDGGKAITSYGICWSLTENPDINSNHVDFSNQGAAISNYNCSLTSLQEYTTYNVRAYATNTDGTSYGNMLTFTTLSLLPVNFTTKEITNIAATSAITSLPELDGTVIQPGVFNMGICYNTSTNPTILNNLIEPFLGVYILKGLLPNTTYYVRAYYTNLSTNITNYGQNQLFTTLSAGTSPQGENAICDGIQITTVVPVTSLTGRVWMDRNLGASRAATNDDWRGSFGGRYQWGRGNDGHASYFNGDTGFFNGYRNINGFTNNTSNIDTPGHGMCIIGSGIPDPNFPNSISSHSIDWRVPKNDNLWQGVNAINNPCPLGYRLPSKEEFELEFATYNITNQQSAVNSPLKLVFASELFYWTSSPRLLPNFGAFGFASYAGNNITIDLFDRASNGCVRCIKD